MTDIRAEDGIVIGNVYDKYESRNPLARKLVDNFLATFDELLKASGADEVHEIGCGEGNLAQRIRAQGISVRGSDFSVEIVEVARRRHGAGGISFQVRSVYDLKADEDSAPLIVCCEVLEHLEDPERALSKLASIAREWAIFSVPREPIWSALNMARGQYWSDWGNTPGHLQRWSSGGFIKLVSRYFDVVTIRRPLPWTMTLCKARGW